MKKLLFILLALFLISGLFAQTSVKNSSISELPPIVDIEVFFGDPEIAGAQISPDGNFISFRKPYEGVMNIWVKKFDEPFENAKPVTAESKRPLTNYFWSRDSKNILFVQDSGGDENFRLYAVNPFGDVDAAGIPLKKDLTPFEKIRVYILSLPHNDNDKILVGINDRDPSIHDVYEIKISTGERNLVLQNDIKAAGFIADKNGVILLASKQTEDGGTELLKVSGNNFERVYSVNSFESVDIEGFTEDSKFAYINTNKGDDVNLSRLELLNIETGATEVIESDPENEVDLQGIFISDKTNKLIGTIYVGDRIRYNFRDNDWKNVFEFAKSKLPDGDIRITSMSDDENKLIVFVSRDVDQGSAYVYDVKAGTVDFLYKSNPKLPTEYLSEMKPIKYTARDGMQIPAYVVLPKGVEPINLPTVIFPHGGPWARDMWGYNPYAQFLANRGYAVLIPNFRGSTGFGKKFLNAGNNEWGTGFMQHDLTDGVKYMVDNGYTDKKKVAIMGGSYGGYATLAGLAFTPEIYAAGVSIVGPSNLITLLKSIPPYWGPIRKMFDIRLGNIEIPADVERLKKQSPLFSAKNIKSPLLVIQGANDPRVKQAESDQIVATLRELKRPVEYILAPDEGHGFAGKTNRMAMVAKIDKFLSKFLGGRSQDTYSPDVLTKLIEITVDVNSVKMPENVIIPKSDDKGSSLDINFAGYKETKLNYDVKISVQGRDFNINGSREFKTDGDKIVITDEAKTQMGNSTDVSTIDSKTLLPISRVSTQGGKDVLKLNFTKEKVTGKIEGPFNSMDIDKPLDGTVYSDGSNFDLIIMLLNYKDGFKTFLRSFDYMTQEIKNLSVEVSGKENISIKAGKFDCYKIIITNTDGEKDFYWVSIEKNPKILKSETGLPSMMGGGKITSELVSFN
jgi:dipeptidyl aminopeptidase/acylaminoacyl peptidase